ncbi:hypothetical protein BD309DRAFT_981494 [Dichomitus squalens]|nr:hypothetical protein BD309DRAFT_981494 [Dichomitus squalens]
MPRNATVVKLGQDNDPLATAPEKNVKTTLDARIRITGSPHGNGIIRGLRCYPYGGRPEEYRSVVPHYKCPRARPPRVMTINLESARYARSTCWQGPFLVRVVARASENPYSLKPASASDEEEKGYVQQPSLIMATETAAASTTSLQVTNDDARGTLIVSASTGATPNGTADVEQLRWVGSQFIYFLDIPCVEIYAYPSSPSTSSDEPNETESDDPSETESDEPSGTDSSDSSSRPCIRSAEFVSWTWKFQWTIWNGETRPRGRSSPETTSPGFSFPGPVGCYSKGSTLPSIQCILNMAEERRVSC